MRLSRELKLKSRLVRFLNAPGIFFTQTSAETTKGHSLFIPKKFIAFSTVVFAVISYWIFSGWPSVWRQPSIPSAKALVSNVGLEKVKEKFDASPIAGEYRMEGASFRKVVKEDKAERTEVRIGSQGADVFEPAFEFKKWDEVRFKIKPVMPETADEEKGFEVSESRMKFKTPREEMHFYELPASESLPDGGYEIEWILNEKPSSSALTFNLETENLEFFYQPIYTEAEIAQKAEEGDFVNPDMMGSYAVYYKDVPQNWVGGKLYRNGKVGQLYRPRIDDAEGNWTWGELKIDEQTKKLTVTIPQEFLDNAVYPIYHASGLVFGYQTAGTAGTMDLENTVQCYRFTMGGTTGVVTTMSLYTNPGNVAMDFNSGIYVQSTLYFLANATGTTQSPTSTGLSWKTVALAVSPTVVASTDYLLCGFGKAVSGSGKTHVFPYDTGTTNYSYTKAGTFPTYPSPMTSPTQGNQKHSVFATYTVPPSAPTGVAATDGTYTDKVTVTWTQSAGATDYRVWRDSTDLGSVGDVATYDDTGAAAPTITPGTAAATDGTYTDRVNLTISGESANNGTTYTYKVTACNAAGCSGDSNTDTGYRGVGALTYQWEVSAADSDASYSNISGATTSSHSYYSAPEPTVTTGTFSATDGTYTNKVTLTSTGASANAGAGRYYHAVLNATGASQQTSTANRGYRGVGALTYTWNRNEQDLEAGPFFVINIGGAPTYDDYSAPTSSITPGTASASDGTIEAYVLASVSGQSASAGAGRYYYLELSAAGVLPATTTNDRGYIGVGSLTYQWQRSSGDADDNATYSNITGATTSTYADPGAPADGSARYWRVVESAAGASNATSTANRGYRLFGSISADIVNASYVSVGSPSVAMPNTGFGFTCATVTSTLGTASEQLYVNNNNGANNGWTLTIAAQATSSVWDSAVVSDYDFNDPGGSGCTDTSDATNDPDTFGGQLSLDPSVATLAVGQCGACTTANISLGSSASFNVISGVNTITLLTATADSDDVGDWTLRSVLVSQKIPAEQTSASDYDINLVLTVTAS